MPEIKELIIALDYDGLRHLLSTSPALANEGISFYKNNSPRVHPLHAICDGVFTGVYSDSQALELAGIFLEHGSDVDGFGLIEKKDTPLIAAASLNAEKVGILYTDRGADIHHAGTHGGTALHWAAWTGRENLVQRLIEAGADIHRVCVDFRGTPLLWAVHGYKFEGGKNRHRQVECVRLLMEAGADKNVSNKDGIRVVEFLSEEDSRLIEMLN